MQATAITGEMNCLRRATRHGRLGDLLYECSILYINSLELKVAGLPEIIADFDLKCQPVIVVAGCSWREAGVAFLAANAKDEIMSIVKLLTRE